jgi:hypothetical protein
MAANGKISVAVFSFSEENRKTEKEVQGRTGELRETVLVGGPSSAEESLVVVRAGVLRKETFARSFVSRSFPSQVSLLLGVACRDTLESMLALAADEGGTE